MKNSTSTLALLGAFILVPMSVALAAGPFNESQARQKIEGAGYTQITGLHEGNNGEWMGDGTHGGKMVMFVLDPNGTVTPTTNATGAGSAAAPVAVPATAGIQVQQAPAQVTVKQAQPDITVTQGQPIITVHQPAPIVSIEVPQPEITVQMPKPQVAVSMAQPQVQVTQPKPQVQVVAAAPAQVDVQPSKPEVNTQQTQAAPVIHYTADQAKVNIKQSPGDPQVKVVDAGTAANTGTSMNAPAVVPVVAVPVATPGQAPAADAGTNMLVSRVLNLNVTNMKGDVLGDVEHVVKNTDGKDYVVIGHGGFLGMGQKHVALPLDSMVLRNGKMEMRGLTDDQIRSMPSWNDNQPGFTDLQNTSSVQVGTAS